VAVEGGRVAWVGSALDAGEPEGERADLGEGILLPGLVNAHCHIELSWLAGKVPLPSEFVPWVAALVEARAAETPDVVCAAAATAIHDIEASGTVAVGDVSNTLAHLALLGASSLAAVVFYELLGWDPELAPEVLRRADRRLDAVGWHPSPNVEVRVAAHAPHSVSPALFKALRQRGGVAALHLAESPTEARFLRDGDESWGDFLRKRAGETPFTAPGLSPVKYVADLGLLHPGLVAAHCVQVDAADRKTLARAGVHVALCPRSNTSLEVGVAPVPEMLADGVRLCLGTDSLASAPTLDLLDDAAALRQTFPSLDAAAIVRMATAGGAEALGFSGLGTITPGKRAAFAFVPMDAPTDRPLEFLVSGEARAREVAA
jgi:cytosine/adenosine deaminase-related metal-dependent hydrolase